MKRNTSITLSREVLAGIDRLAGSRQSRSAFIEAVLRGFLRSLAPAELDVSDLDGSIEPRTGSTRKRLR